MQASIFTVAFISQSLYSRLEPYLSQIAEATDTSIDFSYEDQRFLISGSSSDACDDALANVVRLIDTSGSNTIGADGMEKTYLELPPVDELSVSGSVPSTPLTPAPAYIAPAPVIEHVNLKPAEVNDNDDDAAEEKKSDKHVERATFTFAKNVRNVQLALSPPHQFSQISNEYLHQISRDTNTSCTLDDRTVVITGDTADAVEAAAKRFQVLQAVHKRMKKYADCKPVPVTHYPTKFNHFGLAFCHLPRYAYLSFVDLLPNETKSMQTFFVLVPTFKDSNGEYMPSSLIVDSAPANAIEVSLPKISSSRAADSISSSGSNERTESPPSSQAAPSSPSSLLARPIGKTPQFKTLPLTKPSTTVKEEQKSANPWSKAAAPSPSPSPSAIRQPLPTNSKVVVVKSQSWGSPNAVVSNDWASSNVNGSVQQIQNDSKEEFPSLSPPPKKRAPTAIVASSSPSGSNVAQIERKIRVMRLTNAPADIMSAQPNLSPVEALRTYNFNTIYSTFHSAFEDIRGCKGEFRFSAMLGKVLWKNLKPEVQQQVWEYTDLRDIIQKQYGAIPQFNNVTTTREEVIDSISDLLPQPFKRTAHYEIVANARNQPHCPYSEVVMSVNANIVDLEKVTVSHQTLAEVNWVSLDRKFDFAFKLTKNDQLRTDIKPFSTFIRKMSVSLNSRNITFQNIPDFLDVKQVYFRQCQRFRLHYPFIVEITRVELLPLQRQSSTGAIQGHTGKGDVWFEFEVLFNEHSDHFKENLKLPVGTLASWTSEDMLGPEDTGAKLVEIVKCMLLFVEQSDRVC